MVQKDGGFEAVVFMSVELDEHPLRRKTAGPRCTQL